MYVWLGTQIKKFWHYCNLPDLVDLVARHAILNLKKSPLHRALLHFRLMKDWEPAVFTNFLTADELALRHRPGLDESKKSSPYFAQLTQESWDGELVKYDDRHRLQKQIHCGPWEVPQWFEADVHVIVAKFNVADTTAIEAISDVVRRTVRPANRSSGVHFQIHSSSGNFSVRFQRQNVSLFASIPPIVSLLLTSDRKSFRCVQISWCRHYVGSSWVA